MGFKFNWNALADGAPYVTINATSIAINDAAVSLLKSPNRILIGFDSENKVLGIKPSTGNEEERTYNINARMTEYGWARVGCKDFVRYLSSVLETDFSSAKRYLAEYDENSGILLVKMMKGEIK